MRVKGFIFSILFLAAVSVSCSKQTVQTDNGKPVRFRVSDTDISADVKSLIGSDDIAGSGVTVKVYAERNGAPVTGLDNTEISPDQNTNMWTPGSRVLWNDGTYTFLGYAYSSSLTSVNLMVSNNGKRITVTQPENYEPSSMVDYLLSYLYTADGSVRPVVTLALEHAMSLVGIKIVKSPSITSARLKSLKISGFYRSATMECITPDPYPSKDGNLWTVSYNDENRNASYYHDYGGTEIQYEGPDTEPVLQFMAIPQVLSRSTVLTVEYSVNEVSSPDSQEENYQSHTESFVLQDFRPAEWAGGHRVIYELTVDTGIHLQGMIVPWKKVDMIEGTVLPEL